LRIEKERSGGEFAVPGNLWEGNPEKRGRYLGEGTEKSGALPFRGGSDSAIART